MPGSYCGFETGRQIESGYRVLILPDSIYEERQRLWRAHEDSKLTDEAFYRHLLALYPDDLIGLAGLAEVFREAGDLVSAERYYWRAIESNPCVSSPYFALAQLLYQHSQSRALAEGLNELGILKQLREDDSKDILGDVFARILENTPKPMPAEFGEKFKELSSGERAQLLALTLRVPAIQNPGG